MSSFQGRFGIRNIERRAQEVVVTAPGLTQATIWPHRNN